MILWFCDKVQWFCDFVIQCSAVPQCSDKVRWFSDRVQWFSDNVQWFSETVIQWSSDTVQWFSLFIPRARSSAKFKLKQNSVLATKPDLLDLRRPSHICLIQCFIWNSLTGTQEEKRGVDERRSSSTPLFSFSSPLLLSTPAPLVYFSSFIKVWSKRGVDVRSRRRE